MAQAKAKKLAIAALVLLFGGTAAVVVQQAIKKTATGSDPVTREAKGFAAPAVPTRVVTNESTGKVLVFRNRPSWNRHPDFEDVLADLGLEFEVKPAELMETADLSAYRAVIIPGAQSTSQFYAKYMENAGRFDAYVNNGGTLVLELNGAERAGLQMPRGVTMVESPAKDNTLSLPQHPILTPLGGQPIHASYASHGYLDGVPADALILATEALDGVTVPDKPTFVEYAFGKGRVLAACQCFHDRDNSGRGPLMPTLLTYAGERKWFTPSK